MSKSATNWQMPSQTAGQRARADLRTFQTRMTDDEFANVGLMILDNSIVSSNWTKTAGWNLCSGAVHPVIHPTFDSWFTALSFGESSQSPSWFDAFNKRIDQVREEAKNERISVSSESLNDLMAFVKLLTNFRRPSVFILENGNFRIRWTNAFREQVAIQFRGNGKCQFVFLRKHRNNLEQIYGIKNIDGMETWIRRCDLGHVVI